MNVWLESLAGGLLLSLVLQFAGHCLTNSISAVAIPVAVAAGGWMIFYDPAWLSLQGGLALFLGFFGGVGFDVSSQSQLQGHKLTGRRDVWPLLLWGLGLGLRFYQPALGAALHFVAGGLLLGQAWYWNKRLKTGPEKPESAEGKQNTRIVGFVATALGMWLCYHPGGARGGGAGSTAPAGALLLSEKAALKEGAITLYPGGSLSLAGAGACWSRDGRFLTCLGGNQPYTVQVASADGGGVRTLVTTSELIVSPLFSPDAAAIYFLQGPGFQMGLWKVPVSGGGPEQILPVSESPETPRFSPDGTKLAYFRSTDLSQLSPPPNQIKILEVATGQSRAILTLPHLDSGVPGMYTVTGLSWTADGQSLLLGIDRNNHNFRLERLSLDGNLQPLGGEFTERPFCFRLSPTGAIYALAHPTSGSNQCWKIDPASGTHENVPVSGSPESLDVSPF